MKSKLVFTCCLTKLLSIGSSTMLTATAQMPPGICWQLAMIIDCPTLQEPRATAMPSPAHLTWNKQNILTVCA